MTKPQREMGEENRKGRRRDRESQTDTAQSLGTLHAQPLPSSLLSLGSPYEYKDDFLHTRAQGDRR